MSKYHTGLLFLRQTIKSVRTVVMETAQLVLSQFKNIYNADNWELNKVSLYWKYFNNSVNWLNYVILILEVQFFWDTVYVWKWTEKNGSSNLECFFCRQPVNTVDVKNFCWNSHAYAEVNCYILIIFRAKLRLVWPGYSGQIRAPSDRHIQCSLYSVLYNMLTA